MSMSCRCILVIAVVFTVDGAVAAGEKPIPVADFVRGSQFDTPRLSPDGKHLAMHVKLTQDDKDVHLMTVYAVANLKPVSSVRMPLYELPVDFHWVSDTRIVVEKGKDMGWREVPVWTGEVLATNIDGSKQEYLYGHDMFSRSKRGAVMGDDYGYGYLHSIPMSRNGQFYLRERKWGNKNRRSFLHDVNASSATRKLIAEIDRPGFDFLLQRDGTVRFSFGADEENNYLLFRQEAKGDRADNWALVKDKVDGERFQPFAFTKDDADVLGTLSTAGEPRSLVRQSMTTGARVVLATDARGDMNRLQFASRDPLPFAVGDRIGIPKVKYLDAESADAKLHKLLSSKFPGESVVFTSFSDDASKLVFLVHSDRNPGDFYLFDRATNKAEHLFAQQPAINPERMAERRPIELKARGGEMLFGYITLPPGKDAKKLPLVLMPHGGPIGVDDEWFFDADAQFLASRGYAVMQVNYRGSSGRGPNFREAGYLEWGSGIQDDLIDAVRWTTASGLADPARVCIFGASFGAYSAMMAPIRAPELFKCAVGLAGVYDLKRIYDREDIRRNKSTLNFFVKSIGQDPVVLTRDSPALHAEKLNLPIMLAHGEDDDITPLKQAEVMHTALNKAGKAHEWMVVPNEGHGFHAEKNRIAFYEKLEAFLAKHLGK